MSSRYFSVNSSSIHQKNTMNKTFFTLVLGAICCFSIYSQNTQLEIALQELDKVIEERDRCQQEKLDAISQLKGQFISIKHDKESAFQLSQELFEAYSTFKYDSAFYYAKLMNELSAGTANAQHLNISRLKLSFSFLAGGLFKEAIDTLNVISLKNLLPEQVTEYYFLKSRLYFEMAEYTTDAYFTNNYNTLGYEALEKTVEGSPKYTKEYYSALGLLHLRKHDFENARGIYEYIFDSLAINFNQHELAIAKTNYSWVYRWTNEPDKANALLAEAAIADIKAAVKETVALRFLAQFLFEQGDVDRAYKYINIALDEATYYEANHRKMQVSKILPIIEKERLRLVEAQKKKFIKYLMALSFLSILVLGLISIVLIQFKRLKQAQQALQKSNKHLSESNIHLQESNKIKEEYIAHFINSLSENIDKIEKLKKAVSRLLTTKNYTEIRETFKNLDIKKEREKLFADFDRSFLNIFPNFIEELNKLFKEEEQIQLGKDKILPPEIRIVALIRLGITDSEGLSKILNYSLNTIYTYKTKVKNRTIISNKEFEDKIMGIRVS